MAFSNIYATPIDDITLATLKETLLNDATYNHAVEHVNLAANLIALGTKVGIDGTGQATPLVNRVLYADGTGTTIWSSSPTLPSLTLSTSLALNGAATVANNVKINFKNLAGSADGYIYQDTSDVLNINCALRINLNTGTGADMRFSENGTMRAQLDWNTNMFIMKSGHGLQVNSPDDLMYTQMYRDASNMIYLVSAGSHVWQTAGGVTQFAAEALRGLVMSGRFNALQGGAVASASTITLGVGNYFSITGTTTINNIVATNWQAGAEVTLRFNGNITISHNAAGSGARMFLAGAANFSATDIDQLTLIFNGTEWIEKCRSVN